MEDAIMIEELSEGARLASVILDEVPGDLDGMMRLAAEMLVACALIIEREIGTDNARRVLRLTGEVLAEEC